METVGFLLRHGKCPQGVAFLKKHGKLLMPTLRRACDDVDPKVREHVFQLVAQLVSLCGDMQVVAFLDDIDKAKLQQIRAFTAPTIAAAVQADAPIAVAMAMPSIAAGAKKLGKPVARPVKEVLIGEAEIGERSAE